MIRLTTDEEKGIDTLLWLETLNDMEALSYLCTWLECTILGRGLNAEGTLAALVKMTLGGIERARKGAENDREG